MKLITCQPFTSSSQQLFKVHTIISPVLWVRVPRPREVTSITQLVITEQASNPGRLPPRPGALNPPATLPWPLFSVPLKLHTLNSANQYALIPFSSLIQIRFLPPTISTSSSFFFSHLFLVSENPAGMHVFPFLPPTGLGR